MWRAARECGVNEAPSETGIRVALVRQLPRSLILLGLLHTCTPASGETIPPPAQPLVWGSSGTGPGQFDGSRDVVVAPDGKVLVADHGNRRIQRFSSSGEPLSSFSVTGSLISGVLRSPENLAVGQDATLYTIESSYILQRYQADGTPLESISTEGASVLGPTQNPLRDIARSTGYLFVLSIDIPDDTAPGIWRLNPDLTGPHSFKLRLPEDVDFAVFGDLTTDCNDSVFVTVRVGTEPSSDFSHIEVRGYSHQGELGSRRALRSDVRTVSAMAFTQSQALYYVAQFASPAIDSLSLLASEQEHEVRFPPSLPPIQGITALAADSSCHLFLVDERDRVVRLTVDMDQDGVCDCWEKYGIRVPGSHRSFVPQGASPRRKELFVEMDAMHRQNPANSHALSTAAEAQVRDYLLEWAGLTLQLQRDSLFVGPHQAWLTSERTSKFTAFKDAHFGTQEERDLGLVATKRLVYRYCVAIHDLADDANPNEFALGAGELKGNDFVIAMGRVFNEGTPDPRTEAGVFLHELGHTLGLGHGGGFEHLDRKPNYVSVMNYAYVAPRVLNGLGSPNNPIRLSGYPPLEAPGGGDRLDENALVETAGIGGAGLSLPPKFRIYFGPPDSLPPDYQKTWHHRPVSPRGIDWNRDGGFSSSPLPPIDLNARFAQAPAQYEVLESYNDSLNFVVGIVPWLGWRGPESAAVEAWQQDGLLTHGTTDDLDLPASQILQIMFGARDCNSNSIDDELEVGGGEVLDADGNGEPDVCEPSRILLFDPVVTVCPAGDLIPAIYWEVDLRGILGINVADPLLSGFAVIKSADIGIRVWDYDGRSYGEGDTIPSVAYDVGTRRLIFSAMAGSGCGVLRCDINIGSIRVVEGAEVQCASFDQDANSIGTVDEYDVARMREAFAGLGGMCLDFDRDGMVTGADSLLFNTHLGHTAQRRLLFPNGGENFPWGAFVPIRWRRGFGDSARVKLELVNGATGVITTLASESPDDGIELWPAYATDAPGSQYQVRVTHLAGSLGSVGSDASDGYFTIEAAQGGCPIVSSLTPNGWIEENSILGRSLSAAMGLDAYRLRFVSSTDSVLRLRIVESEEEITSLDQVRLVAVDHPPDVRVYPIGEKVKLGRREPARRVRTSGGLDITELLIEGGAGFMAGAGETLYVSIDARSLGFGLGRTTGGGGTIIDDGGGKGGPSSQLRAKPATSAEIDAQVLSSTGILAQVRGEDGKWQTVAHHYPRERRSETLIDSLSSTECRLVFLDAHRLNFVGRLVESAAPLVAHKLALVEARHSRSGDVLGEVVSGGNVTTTIDRGDTLELAFLNVPSGGSGRDYLLLSHGVYSASLPARLGPAHGPKGFALEQCTPNPATTFASVEFSVSLQSRVKITVFDVQGREVRTLTEMAYEAGRHVVSWDCRDSQGRKVAAGVYLCRLDALGYRAARKLLVVD